MAALPIRRARLALDPQPTEPIARMGGGAASTLPAALGIIPSEHRRGLPSPKRPAAAAET